MESFAERLKFALKDGSVNALAKKAGVSEAVLRKYVSGVTVPGLDKAKALADALVVSFEWLATGRGGMEPHVYVDDEEVPKGMEMAMAAAQPQHHIARGMSLSLATSKPAPSVVLIPVVNVSASAGGGSLILDEENESFIAFSKLWLEHNGLQANKLFTLPTVGESMEPTIKAGEYLLCSRADHHKKVGDGIYIVRIDGHILVKRLQVLPRNKIAVTSDNKAYAPYEVELDDGVDFKILGKVIFVHGLRRV